MNPQQFRFLNRYLPEPLARVRRGRLNTPQLMPDNEELGRELLALFQQACLAVMPRRPALDLLAVWVLIGLLLYGPHRVPLSRGRFNDALAFVQRWRQRRNGRRVVVPFQGVAVLQLVFAYGLGVGRGAGRVRGESAAQAAAWGADQWSVAEVTLHRALLGLAITRIRALVPLGFTGIELLGVRVSTSGQSNRGNNSPEQRSDEVDELTVGRQLATHTLGVLLGRTPYEEFSARFFRTANPGSPDGQAEIRHREQQLLNEGWLQQLGWPRGRDYDQEPYSIGEFVARAVGDVPSRTRGFESGIWFPLFSVEGCALEVRRVLVCSQCRQPLARFERCPNCELVNPHNMLMYWLVPENDPKYQAGVGKECRGCGRYAPEEQVGCPCGSPGLGFSEVIPGSDGQKRCLNPKCTQLVGRTVHVCPDRDNCKNADYSTRPTRFDFRLPNQRQFNPNAFIPTSPETDHLSDDLREAAVAAVNALPPEQRAVIEATHWLGFTLEEFASRAGCSVDTATAHFNAGIRTLRELLAPRSAEAFPADASESDPVLDPTGVGNPAPEHDEGSHP